VSGLDELSREELIALVQQLRESNVALEERVRQLERQASRNSGNSSMPPSSDDLPGRTKPTPKRVKNSGRKRGKQQGAQGTAMPWVSIPDEWVPHRPRGRCECGTDLADGHCCVQRWQASAGWADAASLLSGASFTV
jgi:transposase